MALVACCANSNATPWHSGGACKAAQPGCLRAKKGPEETRSSVFFWRAGGCSHLPLGTRDQWNRGKPADDFHSHMLRIATPSKRWKMECHHPIHPNFQAKQQNSKTSQHPTQKGLKIVNRVLDFGPEFGSRQWHWKSIISVPGSKAPNVDPPLRVMSSLKMNLRPQKNGSYNSRLQTFQMIHLGWFLDDF